MKIDLTPHTVKDMTDKTVDVIKLHIGSPPARIDKNNYIKLL